MAITNASKLADVASGIGLTILDVDTSNKQFGIGTDAVGTNATMQVGSGVTVYGDSGIVSATKYYGDGSNLDNAGCTVSASNGLERLVLTTVTSGTMTTCTTDSNVTWNQETSTLSVPNVNVSGTMTQEDVANVDSTGIVTAGLGLRSTEGGLVVTAGVSTFTPYPAIDANEEVQVGTAIQLGKAGIVTALGLDISTGGVDIDGQTDLDELVVAGVATFSAALDIGTGGVDIDGQIDLDEVAVAGVATFAAALHSSDIRIKNIAEESSILAGNTVDLNWGTNGNVAICTTPSGDVTLRVNAIPTSGFDNQNITFTAIVASSGTARTCTAVKLNGVAKTILWAGGSLGNATDGLTTSMGYIVQSFTGINTIGSGSTAANYQVLGVVNGPYDA